MVPGVPGNGDGANLGATLSVVVREHVVVGSIVANRGVLRITQGQSLTVAGNATLWVSQVDGSLSVGGTLSCLASTIVDGLLTAKTITIHNGGALVLVGASVRTDILNVLANGKLSGAGKIIGDVISNGLLDIADNQGQLAIFGDLSTLGSTTFNLFGANITSNLVVDGIATLGGDVDVDIRGVGAAFHRLMFANFVQGNFANLRAPAMVPAAQRQFAP